MTTMFEQMVKSTSHDAYVHIKISQRITDLQHELNVLKDAIRNKPELDRYIKQLSNK